MHNLEIDSPAMTEPMSPSSAVSPSFAFASPATVEDAEEDDDAGMP